MGINTFSHTLNPLSALENTCVGAYAYISVHIYKPVTRIHINNTHTHGTHTHTHISITKNKHLYKLEVKREERTKKGYKQKSSQLQ